MKSILHRPFFIRLFHWEYWPFHVVYAPIYLYWIWLCIKARSFFFFNAANPTITNGGFLLEKKHEIYPLLPDQYYPQTILFPAGTSTAWVSYRIQQKNWKWPLIAKPDIGMRGLGVQKLESVTDLLTYAKRSAVDFLVQEYVAYEEEAGIFYYRMPGEKQGHISGIVGKQLLTVTGDGISDIETLLKNEPRFLLQLPVLQKEMGNSLKEIPANGEKRLLVPYGNHARGACFLDISHRINEELTRSIDSICQQIPGFYFGRLDIRYRSWEELCKGQNLSIIELNGAGSEPTHIYDPEHSIFFAWKEIIRHWNILYRISIENNRLSNIPFLSFRSGCRMFRDNGRYLKKLAV
jgi:hypothetical protein